MDKKDLKWVLLAAGAAVCSVGLLVLYKNKPEEIKKAIADKINKKEQ